MMKQSRFLPLLVGLALLLGGCNLFSPESTPQAEALGNINIQFSRVSPIILDSLRQTSIQSNTNMASRSVQPRAFLIGDDVEIRLYNGSGTLVDSATTTATPGGSEWFSTNFNTLPGAGYTVEVDIFNSDISETVPVVSGISEPFEVVAGEITETTVSCIPVDPLSLTDGVTSPVIDILPSYYSDSPVETFDWGGEAWFSFVASGDYAEVTYLPSDNTKTGQYLILYDHMGSKIDIFGGLFSEKPTIITSTIPGETYYIGAINLDYWLNDTQMYIPGTFTVLYTDLPPFDDGNDSIEEAVSLTLGNSLYADNLGSEIDKDYFSFPAVENGVYAINFKKPVDNYTLSMRLLDSSGTVQEPSSWNGSIGIYSGTLQENYYIEVQYNQYAFHEFVGDYSLQVVDLLTTFTLPIDVWTEGEVISEDYPVWFEADVTGGQDYMLNWDAYTDGTGEYSLHTSVSVYQEDQTTTYFTNETEGYSQANAKVISVPQGQSKLYVQVSGYNSSYTGSFALKLSEKPVSGSLEITLD